MSIHPHVLAQVAFLERPHSRKELHNAVPLIEEKFSVLKERQWTQSRKVTASREESRRTEASRNASVNSHTPKCWNCGCLGHMQCNGRKRASQSGNGQMPGGR